MAVKPAELSTARAAPAVAAAAAAVVGAGRGVAAAAAVVAIHRSEYSCGSLYGANTHQHTHLLGLKSHAEAAQPCTGGHGKVTAARRGHGGGGSGGSDDDDDDNSGGGGGGRVGGEYRSARPR